MAAQVTELSLSRVWEVVRKRRRILLLTALLVTLGFTLYAFAQADRYRAEVFVAVEGAPAQGYVKSPESPINLQEKIWLIRENLLSRSAIERVIDEFGFFGTPSDSVAPWREGVRQFAARFLRPLGIGGRLNPGESQLRERQINQLKSRIWMSVEAADGFTLGFEGVDPEKTAGVLNRLAEMLVERTSQSSRQRSSSAAEFLDAEVARVKQELDQQNARIRAYQASMENGLPATLEMDLRLIESLESRLSEKRQQIADSQAKLAAVAQEIEGLSKQGVLETETYEKSAAEIRLEELRNELEALSARYTPEHPEVRRVQSEVRELEEYVAANPSRPRKELSPSRQRLVELQGQQQELQRRAQSDQKLAQDLTARISSYRRRTQAAPVQAQTLESLKREYDTIRAQYQAVLEKRDQAQLEARLKEAGETAIFRIVRPAQVPVEPYAPKRMQISLLGLLTGLGMGLLLAFVQEQRDSSFESAEEIRNAVSLPLLAVIPALPAPARRSERWLLGAGQKSRLQLQKQSRNRPAVAPQIVALRRPRSIPAEQYGLLAMQVRHLLARESSRVITVTSAAGGEGKTITCINLGVMLARTAPGQVLLLECDLRRPRIHEYLRLDRHRGLGSLLTSPDAYLESHLVNLDQLCILPGGPPISDPLEMLTSNRMRGLMDRLRRRFQWIVVDTPPILPIADSRILADLSDGTILVVRARHTRRELLQYAMEAFAAPNMLGVVLNGVELQRSRYAAAYEYYDRHYLLAGKERSAAR